jgi:hypothetical protein
VRRHPDREGHHRHRRAQTIHWPPRCRSCRLRQTPTTTVRASCCGMRGTRVAALPTQWSRTAAHIPYTDIPEWASLPPSLQITAHQMSLHRIVMRRVKLRKFPLPPGEASDIFFVQRGGNMPAVLWGASPGKATCPPRHTGAAIAARSTSCPVEQPSSVPATVGLLP